MGITILKTWAAMGIALSAFGCGGALTEPRKDPAPRPEGKPVEFAAIACCGNDCSTGKSLSTAHFGSGVEAKGAPKAAGEGETAEAGAKPVARYQAGIIESEEDFVRVFGCSSGLDFSKRRVYTTLVGGTNVTGHLWGVTEHGGEILVYVENNAVCQGMADDMSQTLVVALPAGKVPVNLKTTYKAGEPCGPVP